jgi:hypothetical protein
MASRDPERYFDRRTIQRHLKRGLVSDADYGRYVETLPDVSDKIKPRDEGGDDDGFDGRGRPKTSSTPLIRATMPDPRSILDDDDYDDDDDDYDDEDDDEDEDEDDVSDDKPAQVAAAPQVVATPELAATPEVVTTPEVTTPEVVATPETDEGSGPTDLG